MKMVLYLLLLLNLPLAAQNGSTLRVEPATVSKVISVDNLDEDFEDVTAVVVTNNSGRTIQLVRETVQKNKPGPWTYRTLDRLSHSTPYVMTESEQSNGRSISLGPGQSATYFLVVRPEGVAGGGEAEIRFSDLTIPGTVLATATIRMTLDRRELPGQGEPQSRPDPATVRLYPNPATEKFFVESPRNVRIGRVEVTNTLGRRIRSFEGDAGANGYDIQSLPDGLYLIAIYDETGKKLKTLRLLHRQFGA